jgi:hypothetical protein
MFEKLFMLVKNNAGTALLNSSVIPEKYHEAVINDASSSIIEVLKSQVENGKLKDMIKYFQYPGIYNNPLITSTVNKFANKLNNFYGVEPVTALLTAKTLIPPVMQELILQSKGEKNTDFELGKLLSSLTGNYNMSTLLSQLAVA